MAFSLRVPRALCGAWLLISGCADSSTADALIGPDGGSVVHEDGVTLTVPPGALSTFHQIIIRPSDEKLSRGSFEQVGGSYLIEPRILQFKIPAQLTFDKSVKDKPSVLIKPGETRVIAYSSADDKPTAYIGSLGIVAAAKGGDPVAVVDAPTLSRTPDTTDLKGASVNVGELMVSPTGVTTLDVGFTAFDPTGESLRLLNGEGSSYCGFKFGSVTGASIIGGCSTGTASGSLALNNPQATVQVLPFLIGKLERPVIVEVQLGNGDLAISAGYFAFNTSPCFLESCSGKGLCDDTSGKAVCTCDDGYAPGEALSCDCVPQCEGRQCAGDGCGGNCQPGCNADTHSCNFDNGQCVPLPPPETTGDDSSGDMSTGPSTTTTGDPSTTTTGDPSTTTTGDASSTTSGSSTGSTGSST